MVSVPASFYPWVLLVALQVFMPNLSFLGHLAGILAGTLEYHGALDALFVRDSFLVYLESLPVLRKITALESFVGTSTTQLGACGQRLRAESSSSSYSPVMASLRKCLGTVAKFLRDLLETLLVCVCGRNCRLRDWNASRFWPRRARNDATERGVIRPPEFYDGALYEDDDEEEEEEEREPLALSRLV